MELGTPDYCEKPQESSKMNNFRQETSLNNEFLSFLVALVVKNLSASAGDIKRCGFDPWGWVDPLVVGMATDSSILA